MFCTGCGNKLNETDKFCKVCGVKNLYYDKEAVSVNHKGEAATIKEEPQKAPIEEGNDKPQRIQSDNIIQPEMVIMPVEQMGNSSKKPEILINKQAEHRKEKPESKVPSKIKTKKLKSSAGLMVGSVLLSVFAFVLIVVFMSTLFAKTILSEKTMTTAIQEIDYTEIEVGNVLSNSELDITVEEGDTTIDVIYEALTEQGQVDISRSDLEQIFEEATFTEYISEKLAQYARFAVTGEELDEVTALDIVDLVDENKKIIEEASGLEITEKDLDELEDYLEEDELLEALSTEKLENTLENNNLNKVQNIFSDTVLLIIMIISLILFLGDIVLIGFLHKKFRAELSFIGIPLLTGGVLFTVGIFSLYILKDRFFGELEFITEALKPVLKLFFTRGIIIGGITSIIGIIMVTGYGLIKKRHNNNWVKEA